MDLGLLRQLPEGDWRGGVLDVIPLYEGNRKYYRCREIGPELPRVILIEALRRYTLAILIHGTRGASISCSAAEDNRL